MWPSRGFTIEATNSTIPHTCQHQLVSVLGAHISHSRPDQISLIMTPLYSLLEGGWHWLRVQSLNYVWQGAHLSSASTWDPDSADTREDLPALV